MMRQGYVLCAKITPNEMAHPAIGNRRYHLYDSKKTLISERTPSLIAVVSIGYK